MREALRGKQTDATAISDPTPDSPPPEKKEAFRLLSVAEGVGFEPTDAFTSPVFKTGAFNRSAISPDNEFTSNSQTQE